MSWMNIVLVESRKGCEIIQYITEVSLFMDFEGLKQLFGTLCTWIDWPGGSGGRSKENVSSLHSSAVQRLTPISKIEGPELTQCEC
jgi:hypothetical protein